MDYNTSASTAGAASSTQHAWRCGRARAFTKRILTTRTAHYESFTVSGTGYNDNAVVGVAAVVDEQAGVQRVDRAQCSDLWRWRGPAEDSSRRCRSPPALARSAYSRVGSAASARLCDGSDLEGMERRLEQRQEEEEGEEQPIYP